MPRRKRSGSGRWPKNRFLPAWAGMAELQLVRGQWPELLRMAQRLEGEFHAHTEADVLRARSHLARKEFQTARKLAEQAIAHAPEMLLARRVLSYAYLQEGKDMAAAEEELREVLRLSPNDKEANNNLTVLVGQRNWAYSQGQRIAGFLVFGRIRHDTMVFCCLHSARCEMPRFRLETQNICS